MPSLISKRGRKRYIGKVWVDGVLGPQKLFPDASKKSYRDAIDWENKEREKLRRKLRQTRTDYLTIREWANDYMTFVQTHLSRKTYDEKRSAMKRFVEFNQVSPDMEVEKIDRYLCASFFTGQMQARSGNAVNKDRKNLGAAWQWARENIRDWPVGENPFLAVAKKPEERHPRYVPPEADFWKVYDYVAGLAEKEPTDYHIQDRVMLLAYLHLAARRTELFNAKWSDVDFASAKIRLWTRKRKDSSLECDWLPISDDLKHELKQWAKIRLAHATADKEHIFVSLSDIECSISYYGLPFVFRQHTLRTWCDKVKVKPFGWHAIRHLSASILYRKEYGQSFIQAILRHKSPTTTARYMRSLGSNDVRVAVNEGFKREGQVIPFDKGKTASGGRS